MKSYQKFLVACFVIMNIFYFPWFRIERSIVTDKHKARTGELKDNLIVDYELSKEGHFDFEVIFFDTCSISYKLLTFGYRGKELIFFVDYQHSPSSKIRHFIKVDMITPPPLQSFFMFSSYVVLMGITLFLPFSTFLNKRHIGGV